MTPGKGSKYREFYDLSGRITCMGTTASWVLPVHFWGVNVSLLKDTTHQRYAQVVERPLRERKVVGSKPGHAIPNFERC